MKHVYFVGAPTTEKGIDDFNEIASFVNTAKFYWFCFRIDTKLVKKYKYINFREGLSDEKLKKNIIDEMDYFICCSHFEGFCLPIAEAILLKKPVISYDLDEIKSEFQDNIEYAHDLEEFKIHIQNIIEKNNYSKDLNKSKRFIEKNYSPEVVSKRLLKIVL